MMLHWCLQLFRMLRMSLMLVLRLVLLCCSPSAPPLTGSSEIATSHANQLSMFNFLYLQSLMKKEKSEAGGDGYKQRERQKEMGNGVGERRVGGVKSNQVNLLRDTLRGIF
jgi:hypothetical protein